MIEGLPGFLCVRFLTALALAGASSTIRAADPLELFAPQATFYAGAMETFASVVDGVETGPGGWSVAGGTTKPQSLVVNCLRPVEAAELDVSLFFLAGKPFNPMAEFTLSFTNDEEPSLEGHWQPLEILRFNSQATTLERISSSGLRAARIPYNVNGGVPDEIYRITAVLPGRRATGFRVDTIPVPLTQDGRLVGLSWYAPHDFTLTEFRVAIHQRETTNIAHYQPARSSHPLYLNPDRTRLRAEALTDGLPATIAHPGKLPPDSGFFYEIDLGRICKLDHIGLRTRGDEQFERFTRVQVSLFTTAPDRGAAATWQGMARADGKHPPPGAVETLVPADGNGEFSARYLRISSDSPLPYSPQLAEVEVYESRCPEIVAAVADGREIPVVAPLVIPPGTKRLSLRVQIPGIGLPPGDWFRWRVRNDMGDWRTSRLWTLDMACPPPGQSVFEAQALHSDRQWDATVLRLPILVRQHFWMSGWFQWSSALVMAGLATGTGIFWSRRRAARQLTRMKAEAALSTERARIARDMHDEVGGKLARLSLLGEIVLHGQQTSTQASPQLTALTRGVREVAVELEQVIWSLSPKHDLMADLVRHIYQYAEDFFADTPVICRFGPMADIPPDIKLRPEPRNALFRSFKEAVANILKHAHTNTAQIDVRYDEGFMEIRAADKGCGFDSAALKSSTDRNGLTNMHERMNSIGGTCAIQSGPSGTTVVLRWEVKARG
jgi:signal transduction histidine kinase